MFTKIMLFLYEQSDQNLHYLSNSVTCNSLTTKQQMTNSRLPIFKIILNPSFIILRIQRLEGKRYRSR